MDDSTLKTMVLFDLMFQRVFEGLYFWYPCCVALDEAMLGDKKFF